MIDEPQSLQERDTRILMALTTFIDAVALAATNSETFRELVYPKIEEYFAVHLKDPRAFEPLKDDEQLRLRYIRIVQKLDPVVELIDDAAATPLSPAQRTKLLSLYDDFREVCAEEHIMKAPRELD